MATIIRTDGTVETLTGEDVDGAIRLKQLQDVVGGYIEQVTLADGSVMILNEHGKLLPGFAPNPKATKLLHDAGGMPWDTVMGDVVVATLRPDGEVV